MYEKVILIGFGKIAVDCLAIIKEQFNKQIIVLIHEDDVFSSLQKVAQQLKLEIKIVKAKNELTNYLRNITDDALIVSANNNYLFPRTVVTKENLRIVNFHNALLPSHKGRNAQTWAIFEQDLQTGITWHIVDEQVDHGLIIKQETIPLNKKITALKLTKECMIRGAQVFKDFLPDLLQDKISLINQEKAEIEQLHLSKDLPNNGWLDLSWNIDKISAFLRSMDYGRLDLMPFPKIQLFGTISIIRKYNIFDSESTSYGLEITKETIVIRMEGIQIKLYISSN